MGPLQLDLDRSVKLAFNGASLSSDGGLLLYRVLDDALLLAILVVGSLTNPRTGRNRQHQTAALLRQSIYSRLANSKDIADTDRLRIAPVMQRLIGGQVAAKKAASSSTMARFETQIRATRKEAV